MAGRTSKAWFEIPKGTQVGVALGDLQASVYSCMAQKTDAGKSLFGSLLQSLPGPHKPQLCVRVQGAHIASCLNVLLTVVLQT